MVDGLGLKYDKGIEIIYSLEKKEIPKFQGSVQCTVRFPAGYIAAIVISCLILLCIPIVVLYLLKQKRQNDYEKRYERKLSKIDSLIQRWDDTQNSDLMKEWDELSACSKQEISILNPTCDDAHDEFNIRKNRYIDILPYDHSRVKIVTNDEDSTDYINANFIPGPKSKNNYIATQGPLSHTIEDFWRMVWEQRVTIIVMLTQTHEGIKRNLKQKCETYWPEHMRLPCTYGDITVSLLSINQNPDFIIRKLRLELDGTKYIVRQYQYLTWPDRKCPRAEKLYEFIDTIRQNSTKLDNRGPVVVHCSAGIGRTGVYIVVDTLIQQLNHRSKHVNIFNKVLEIRRYRQSMVQNQFQYRFIYEMVNFYYKKAILKVEPSNQYELEYSQT